jgi:large subunit ribosomal protein L33
LRGVANVWRRGRIVGMASKKQTVEIIALACTECKRRNYTTTKNRKTMQEKLELNKYCKWCRKHTAHKETKVK